MSIAALVGGAVRIGVAGRLPGAIGKVFGRKARKRARTAAAAAPTLAERAAGLVARIGARPALMPGMIPRRRRRRGITAAEIRGFKKLSRLLSQFGMRPRGLARPMARGRRPFSRARFGDIDDGGEE